MTPAQSDFENWFVNSLKDLRDNGDAGFIFALVAFPILERYLRNKSGCPEGKPLTPEFFSNLVKSLPEISGKERDFWDCYRNGLLHQVTFPKAKLVDKKAGIWVSLPSAGISGHGSKPVYIEPKTGGFFLNPIKFFDHVTTAILSDFSVYEEANKPSHYPLPRVGNPSTAQPGTTPTIGLPLTSGSFVMHSDPKKSGP
jgi:hypothetical protein